MCLYLKLYKSFHIFVSIVLSYAGSYHRHILLSIKLENVQKYSIYGWHPSSRRRRQCTPNNIFYKITLQQGSNGQQFFNSLYKTFYSLYLYTYTYTYTYIDIYYHKNEYQLFMSHKTTIKY